MVDRKVALTFLAELVGDRSFPSWTKNDRVLGRYVTIIEMQQSIYSYTRIHHQAWDELRREMCAPGRTPDERDVLRRRLHQERWAASERATGDVDRLFAYMMGAFGTGKMSEEDHLLYGDILTGWLKIDALSLKQLLTISPLLVPQAVAKTMFTVERVPINIEKAQSLRPFSDVYREAFYSKCRPVADRARLYPAEAERRGILLTA